LIHPVFSDCDTPSEQSKEDCPVTKEETGQGASSSVSHPAALASDGKKRQSTDYADIECDPGKWTPDRNMHEIEDEGQQCCTDEEREMRQTIEYGHVVEHAQRRPPDSQQGRQAQEDLDEECKGCKPS